MTQSYQVPMAARDWTELTEGISAVDVAAAEQLETVDDDGRGRYCGWCGDDVERGDVVFRYRGQVVHEGCAVEVRAQ